MNALSRNIQIRKRVRNQNSTKVKSQYNYISWRRHITFILYIVRYRVFTNWGYADPHPTPPPSVLIRFLWMMGSVLYTIRKIKNKLSDVYFSSYREYIT